MLVGDGNAPGHANWRSKCGEIICEGFRTEIVDVEHFYGSLGATKLFPRLVLGLGVYRAGDRSDDGVSCREP